MNYKIFLALVASGVALNSFARGRPSTDESDSSEEHEEATLSKEDNHHHEAAHSSSKSKKLISERSIKEDKSSFVVIKLKKETENDKASKKASPFHELKEIKQGKFIGYGKDSVADFLEKGVPGVGSNTEAPKKPISIEECPIKDHNKYRVCGSDGNTYENLSHFYCAQSFDKELQRLWDGDCSRNEWPQGFVDESGDILNIINPDQILMHTH